MANRDFESDCYIIAIDEHWFLTRGEGDWTEHPAFAQKWGKLRMANAAAAEELEKHPNKNIRVVRLRQRFRVEEIA